MVSKLKVKEFGFLSCLLSRILLTKVHEFLRYTETKSGVRR